MESRHQSDGIGRILSLLAILVALGSAVFLYQDNQGLKTELATIKSDQKGPAVIQEWNEKLAALLNEFETQKKDALDGFDAAREARNRIVEAAMAETDPGLSREEVERIVAAKIESATAEPDLRPAVTVAKPTAEGEFAPVVVKNVGSADAEIKTARFRPKPGGQFMVKTPREPGPNDVVIEFDPRHNEKTKESGAHKFYERTYILLEQIVTAKTSAQVSIEIYANGRHLDWGMEGDLELEYQDGRTVLIRDARAIFVADKEETI